MCISWVLNAWIANHVDTSKHITRLDSFVSGGTTTSNLLHTSTTQTLSVSLYCSQRTPVYLLRMGCLGLKFLAPSPSQLLIGLTLTLSAERHTHSLKNAEICHIFSLKFLRLREVRPAQGHEQVMRLFVDSLVNPTDWELKALKLHGQELLCGLARVHTHICVLDIRPWPYASFSFMVGDPFVFH